MNDIDHLIISKLQEQPDLGYEALGNLVQLNYSSCRRRVQKLYDEAYIKPAIQINRRKILGKYSTFTLVKMSFTDRPAIEYFSDEIAKLSEVDLCCELNGVWDFILRLNYDEQESFDSLRDMINGIKMNDRYLVANTESFVIARVTKENSMNVSKVSSF